LKLLALLFLILAQTAVANPFTTPDRTRNAFGHAFSNLDRNARRQFSVGNAFFRDAWVTAPASTAARDGLGPTFNAVACAACHQLDGRGIGAGREGFAHVSLLFRLQGAEDYGGQVNPFAVDGVSGEAKPMIRFVSHTGSFSDGEAYELREPIYMFLDWLLTTPPPTTRISPRVGNQLIGLGLLERIPAEEIEAQADPDDKDGNGVSGTVSRVMDLRTGQMNIGRFGWKAEQPTIEQQNAGAFLGDMGLTSSLHPDENCPAPQTLCAQTPNGGSPEVSDLILARVTLYVQHLAVPTQRVSEEAQKGEEIFRRVGCAQCHTPSYSIDGIVVYPYTDLLLHDMGEALSDRSLAGDVLPTEWRTPPLWGIGMFQIVNGHSNLLHDGRARGVQEAILWHSGEAERAKAAYTALSREERRNLILFVESL
jgi:CxxC motif-containing protein (DUF1111 family)